MPANDRALQVTDAYRARLGLLRSRGHAVALQNWGLVNGADLAATHGAWVQRTVPALTELQRAGARLSAAYLAGYLTVSLGQTVAPEGTSAAAEGIGQSRTGKALAEALITGVYTIKKAIGDGTPVDEAIRLERDRAIRNAGEDILFPARLTLDSGITASEHIVGWRRVTGGGCGACLAAATGAIQHESTVLPVHDNCQCSKEPVLANDTVRRPTGHQMFEALTTAAQDQLLGPDKAHLVREGAVSLHALLGHSPMEAIPDQITERPLKALTH